MEGAEAAGVGAGQRVVWAESLEKLVANLDRPRALARAVAVRCRAAEGLEEGGWSHARYAADAAHIERLLSKATRPAL